MDKKPRMTLSLRKLLFKIHLWVGLTLCVPLILLGITGSILVFEHEIEQLLWPKHYKLAEGKPHSIEEILTVARNTAPKGFFPTMYRAEEGEPATVRLAGKGERNPANSIMMRIDPVSLAILDKGEAASPLRTIQRLHANLLIPGRDGRVVVGWLGVVMLTLGISGLIIWWPRKGNWRAAFTIKQGAKGFRLHRDLHGSVGIWSLLVFITVSFSGTYLAFPQPLGAAITTLFPGNDLRSMASSIRVNPIEGGLPVNVDQAIDAVGTIVKEGKLVSIMLPSKPDQPYRINIALTDYKPGIPTITAFVDPWSGKIIKIFDPRSYSLGETISSWQRALHAGQGLGIVWRVLVFLSGFLPLLFAITGLSMWLIKRSKRTSI